MKVSERRRRHARRTERHSGARGRIEHPRRHHHDHAGLHLDMDELAPGAPLRVVAANTPPLKRVPSVTNFDVLPEMGRMTVRLRLAATIGLSPARTTAAAALPPCTR